MNVSVFPHVLCVSVAVPCGAVVVSFPIWRFSCPDAIGVPSMTVLSVGRARCAGLLWGLPRWASVFDLVLVPSLKMLPLEPNSGSDSIVGFVSVEIIALEMCYVFELSFIDRDLFNPRCMCDTLADLI